MKASPQDITAVAIDVLAYDLVDMAPFNFQRRSMRDADVMEMAERTIRHPANEREDERRRRALIAANYIMERLEGLGWENTLRTDTNPMRDHIDPGPLTATAFLEQVIKHGRRGS